MTDDNRDRGILTSTDREFLRGEKTYDNRQSRYDRKQEIRKRVKNAVLDFPLLIEQVIDGPLDGVIDWSDDRFREGARDAIGFILLSAGGINPFIDNNQSDPDATGDIEDSEWVSTSRPMEVRLLEGGIERAGTLQGLYVKEVEPPTVKAVFFGDGDPKENLEDGDISALDVFRLLEHEEVSEETLEAIADDLSEDIL